MRNPLAAHPVWKQLLVLVVGLPVVVTLAVLAFAWPAARVQPREVPIGVVGAGPSEAQLAGRLAGGGAFDLHLYPDEVAARRAIGERDVYGAFVLGQSRLDVLEASAASPVVAQLLTGVAQNVAAESGGAGDALTVRVSDVVPLSTADAKGTVLSASLLPLTICSIIVASAIGLAVRLRPAWRQVVALVSVSAVAGAGVFLVAQTWLGALPHDGFATWASLALVILAISSATAGLIALFGTAGFALAAAVMVFVGNPFSAVTSAPEMLPGAVDRIGQWLPPGAGANLLRSSAYFDGNGASGHLAVLLTWAVLGVTAIVVGHHAPIRFAASPLRDAPGAVTDARARHEAPVHALNVGDGLVARQLSAPRLFRRT
ncbi:hypothetical protein CLV35_0333 [Motilibacter peucedani]|uniref:ABC transporter permease n=1 Tax=Motilibacter peucedani TaxID=598650 RepID=A0A420XSW7_9ACTN|nr:ABC transporter permease [Motilibacter peucedani]RKS79918.1 hypothetical protein CLV35_0333 [Motilibacter peucedani]